MAGRKRNITIAVTGLNAVDSPGPGVAVIRSLRESKDFNPVIIGLAYEALEPGIYMHDIVDKTYQIPYPSAGTDALLNRLAYIHEKEKLDAIIPNFDAELFNFVKISGDLESSGIRTFLPSFEMLEARDKVNLKGFGDQHGFLVPDAEVITKVSEVAKAADKFGFPVVVKGKFYDAVICNTVEQAEKAFYKLQAKWGIPVIMQEFISGTEVNVAALGDGNGKAISIVPMRKLFITDKGKAWAGVTIDDDVLMQTAAKFIKATKWKGGCELEIMMTSKREPYIMEVNPRFPAWIYLSTAAGQNQPSSLIKMALDMPVKPFRKYSVGKVFVRYSWDMVIDITEFHRISGSGEY